MVKDTQHLAKMIRKSLTEKSIFVQGDITFDGPMDERYPEQDRAETLYVCLNDHYADDLIEALKELSQWLGVRLDHIRVMPCGAERRDLRAEIGLEEVVPFFTS